MYCLDVPPVRMLSFDNPFGLGRAFHAAKVELGADSDGSELHGHADFFEIMGITAGQGEQDLGSGRQSLTAGDIVLIRPRDQHRIRGLPPGGMTFVNVAFPAGAWRAFTDLVDLHGLEDSVSPPRSAVREPRELQTAFDRILDAFTERPAMPALVRFWSRILELIDHTDQSTVRGESPPAWLTRACAGMRREPDLRGGVAHLVELAAVSPAHLSRSMRRYFGTTPTRFVLEMRVHHAARLLASTTLSITEIATRCGFSSQSYFTRCFQATNRISPREFRRAAGQTFVP